MRTRLKRFLRQLLGQDFSLKSSPKQPFFDVDYYYETNIDIFIKKLDPVEHFIKYGQFEGRDPARTLSADWIQYKYSKLTDNPYLLIRDSFEKGIHLSPSPIFDANYYFEQIGSDVDLKNLTAYEHFLEFGLNNKIRPNRWLDLDEFAKSNPWYFNSAKSEHQKFVNFFDLARNNKFFGDYVCFTLTDSKGMNYQLTENLLKSYLLLKGRFSEKTSKPILSCWEVVDVLNEIAAENFEGLAGLQEVQFYPPKILAAHENEHSEKGTSNDYVFYCHWDSENEVSEWIQHSLNEYLELGLKIVFCTNVKISDLPKFVKDNSVYILQRSNSGHDFESHLLSWRWLKTKNVKINRLFLTNDSIFFPVAETNKLRAAITNPRSKIWGLTQNTSTQQHIQSFFLALESGVTDLFMNWIEQELSNWKFISKMGLITRLELQINQFSETINEIPDYFFVGLDPTFKSWDVLCDFGVPILKVHLVRRLMSKYPGDTELLRKKLEQTFPKSRIKINEILNYARKLELVREESKYWYE